MIVNTDSMASTELTFPGKQQQQKLSTPSDFASLLLLQDDESHTSHGNEDSIAAEASSLLAQRMAERQRIREEKQQQTSSVPVSAPVSAPVPAPAAGCSKHLKHYFCDDEEDDKDGDHLVTQQQQQQRPSRSRSRGSKTAPTITTPTTTTNSKQRKKNGSPRRRRSSRRVSDLAEHHDDNNNHSMDPPPTAESTAASLIAIQKELEHLLSVTLTTPDTTTPASSAKTAKPKRRRRTSSASDLKTSRTKDGKTEGTSASTPVTISTAIPIDGTKSSSSSRRRSMGSTSRRPSGTTSSPNNVIKSPRRRQRSSTRGRRRSEADASSPTSRSPGKYRSRRRPSSSELSNTIAASQRLPETPTLAAPRRRSRDMTHTSGKAVTSTRSTRNSITSRVDTDDDDDMIIEKPSSSRKIKYAATSSTPVNKKMEASTHSTKKRASNIPSPLLSLFDDAGISSSDRNNDIKPTRRSSKISNDLNSSSSHRQKTKSKTVDTNKELSSSSHHKSKSGQRKSEHTALMKRFEHDFPGEPIPSVIVLRTLYKDQIENDVIPPTIRSKSNDDDNLTFVTEATWEGFGKKPSKQQPVFNPLQEEEDEEQNSAGIDDKNNVRLASSQTDHKVRQSTLSMDTELPLPKDWNSHAGHPHHPFHMSDTSTLFMTKANDLFSDLKSDGKIHTERGERTLQVSMDELSKSEHDIFSSRTLATASLSRSNHSKGTTKDRRRLPQRSKSSEDYTPWFPSSPTHKKGRSSSFDIISPTKRSNTKLDSVGTFPNKTGSFDGDRSLSTMDLTVDISAEPVATNSFNASFSVTDLVAQRPSASAPTKSTIPPISSGSNNSSFGSMSKSSKQVSFSVESTPDNEAASEVADRSIHTNIEPEDEMDKFLKTLSSQPHTPILARSKTDEKYRRTGAPLNRARSQSRERIRERCRQRADREGERQRNRERAKQGLDKVMCSSSDSALAPNLAVWMGTPSGLLENDVIAVGQTDAMSPLTAATRKVASSIVLRRKLRGSRNISNS